MNKLLKVPFILQLPDHLYPDTKVRSLVSLADIVPTICSLCGFPADDALDGADLMPLITGKTDDVHKHVLVECIDDPFGLRLKTIVGKRYKLTYYSGEDFGELYDLENDPHELTNLWNDTRSKDIKIKYLMDLLGYSEKLEKMAVRYSYA